MSYDVEFKQAEEASVQFCFLKSLWISQMFLVSVNVGQIVIPWAVQTTGLAYFIEHAKWFRERPFELHLFNPTDSLVDLDLSHHICHLWIGLSYRWRFFNALVCFEQKRLTKTSYRTGLRQSLSKSRIS